MNFETGAKVMTVGRIWRTLGAHSFGQVVQLVIQVGAVPIYLWAWGIDQYGDWIVLSTIPAYLAASDLGFISAASNSMSSARARGDRTLVVVIYRSAWALATLLSLVLIAGFVTLASLFDAPSLLAIDTIDHGQVQLCILLLALYAAVSQQESLVQAGLRAEGRNATGVLTTHCVRLLEVGCAVAIAASGSGPVAVAATLMTVRTIGVLAQFALLRRVAPYLKLGKQGISTTEIRKLWGPSLAFLGLPIGNLLTSQGFLLVLAHSTTGAELVAFSLVRTLSRFGTQVIGVLEASVWPEISFAYGRGDQANLARLHGRTCAISCYLAVLAAVGLSCLGVIVTEAWTGGRVTAQFPVVLLLSLDLVLTALWSTSAVLPAATNQLRRVAVAYIACGSFSLLLLTPMVAIFGIAGAPGAMLICDLLMIPIVVHGSLRLLNEDVITFLRNFNPMVTARVGRRALSAAVRRS